MSVLGEISEIFIYPVKSLPGVRLNEAIITKFGIAHALNTEIQDRKWMIVDENGSFRTQRQLPKMALIRLEIERDHFVFKSTDKGSIDVPFYPKSNNIRKCRVWGTDIDGYSYGGDVAKWLSDVLETPNLDLVVFKSDLNARNVKQGDAKHCTANEQDQTIYADLSSFMLIGENSFESLNSKLDKKVTIRNFRPNFLVKGPEPFAENEWNSFSIDDAKFRKVRQCTRCLLTTVDPDTGVKDPNQEPFQTLKTFKIYEEEYGGKPILGINFMSDNEGMLVKVGSQIKA